MKATLENISETTISGTWSTVSAHHIPEVKRLIDDILGVSGAEILDEQGDEITGGIGTPIRNGIWKATINSDAKWLKILMGDDII